MDLEQRLRYASYVSDASRLIYVETPKAACTAFKLLVASLSGINPRSLYKSLTSEKTEVMTIHDRSLIQLPSIVDLDPSDQRIGTYLTFCVTRHPATRLASAWIDKLLCHSVSPTAPILRRYPLPLYRPDWGFLRESFSEFVSHVEAPEFINSNHHWALQVRLLAVDTVPYKLKMKVENLDRDIGPLREHVERQGITWPGLARVNETHFAGLPYLYSSATLAKVTSLYADDFIHFGYDAPVLPNQKAAPPPLPNEHHIRAIQARNRRISYLQSKLNVGRC